MSAELGSTGSHVQVIEKKEKKSRWGIPQDTIAEDLKSSDSSNDLCGETTKKARTSRWSSVPADAPIEGSIIPNDVVTSSSTSTVVSHETIQQTMILKLRLQQISEQLMTCTQDALAIEKDPNRSPSPPPRYDSNGKRLNTREMRMRDNLLKERISVIEEIIALNPQFTPPADFIKGKPVRRIYIPKVANPLYNYIGLIIGPRGNTQKQMEQETGCKISIRGKGSAKDGSKGRLTKQIDEDDELHCHITGDIEENVERAAKMVEALLVPMNETSLNQHKEKQLRELALINGTLREDEYCPVCGEKGHRQFECPHRAKAFKAANVKCSICGDLSHPTRDCPMKLDAPTQEAQIDTEYDSFLSELSGNGSKPLPLAWDGAAESKSNGGGSEGGSGSSVKALGRQGPGGGPTIVEPVVNLLANRKNQTIIKVTSVMTGYAPPTLLSTNSVPTQAPVMDAYGGYAPPSMGYAPAAVPSMYPAYGMYGAMPPQMSTMPYGMPVMSGMPPPQPQQPPLPPTAPFVAPLPPTGPTPPGYGWGGVN